MDYFDDLQKFVRLKRQLKVIILFFAVTAFVFSGEARESKAASIRQESPDGSIWEFDESTGTLTVSGQTNIESFDDFWNKYKDSVTKLVIADGVTEIGISAFYGYKKVTTLILPEGLKKIGDEAFYECNNLQEINIPQTVTEIGIYAFRGCKRATKLILPEGLQKIEGGAFYECNNLQKINIPQTVTEIGGSAFYGCEKVTELILPEGLKKIGDEAFYECNNLQEINIPQTVTEIGGSAFLGCKKVTTLILPERLQKIGGWAFYECNNLQEINIPETVTEIEDLTFSGCEKVTKLVLPERLQKVGKSAFSNCNNLQKIDIPETVTEIGSYAFSGCEKVTKLTLPEELQKIEEGTFGNCNSLQEINVPASVTEIGSYAFSGCRKVTTLILPEKLRIIEEGTFSDCGKITELILPNGILTIEKFAFSNCNNLQKIIIPSTVIKIGEGAFSGCGNLQEINLPESMTEIGDYAFNGSYMVTQIILPKSLKTIGDQAFSSGYPNGLLLCCSNEEQILFCQENNYSYVDVSKGAIDISKGKATISQKEYIYTGDEIEPEIQIECAFPIGMGETKKSIILRENQDYEVNYSNNKDCGTAEITVKGIGLYTGELSVEFEIYKQLLADNVILEYEEVLYSGERKMPSVTICDGDTILKKDQDYEVSYENNLEEGTATVTVTGKGIYKESVVKRFKIYKKSITAYDFGLGFTEVVYDGSMKKPSVTVKDAEGQVLKEGVDYKIEYRNNIYPGQATVIVTGIGIYKGEKILTYTIRGISIKPAQVVLDETIFTYDGSAKKPQVTVTLNGKVLVQDVDYTLSYQNNIVAGIAQVVIRGIGNYEDEIQMSYTILPGGDGAPSVYDKNDTLISDDLIYTITDDEELEVEVVGVANKNLKKLVIPATVEAEGSKYKVTSIGTKAFYKNTKLTSVIIGNQVASIEDYAFYGCKNVKTIKMGKSVEIIGASTFRKCTKLTSIVLPKSIEKLGKNAFYGCKKLKSITINANSVIDISANAWKGISEKAIFKVPKKLVKKYQKKLKGKTGFKKTMKVKKK